MAANVRPYALAAAAAGYEVLAADIFGDVETQAASRQSLVLPYAGGAFVEAGIRFTLLPKLREFSPDYLLFGSGFEPSPELLNVMGQEVRVLGNTAQCLARCKHPFIFHEACERLRIPTPEVRARLDTEEMPLWLARQIGGSGGMHIKPAEQASEGDYYQRRCEGGAVSLLFLALPGGAVLPVGFHRQILAPTAVFPYRYGGLVSGLQLDEKTENAIIAAAKALTAEFGLIGLNSLDCLVNDTAWWLLEVNPRLSASAGLYERASPLICAHIAASSGEDQAVDVAFAAGGTAGQAIANLVCYAGTDMTIPAGFEWPEWVVDKPLPGSCITRDTPLCTVVGMATSVAQAELQARERMAQLQQTLNKE